MTNFNWFKAVGFGISVWLSMAVGLLILSNIQPVGPLWAHSIVAVLGGAVALFLAKATNATNGLQAAAYGLAWSVITLALDFIVTQRYDTHVFTSWQYWLGIALVFLLPWIQSETKEGYPGTL